MVGYAAVETAAGDVRKIRLIKSWHDLEGLNLAENDSLEEAEIEPLKKQLQQIARQELMPYLAAERIERDNIRAALAQEMLAFMIMHSFLKGKAGFAGKGGGRRSLKRSIECLKNESRLLLTIFQQIRFVW